MVEAALRLPRLRRRRRGELCVNDAMTSEMVTAATEDTIREAARRMTAQDVAAAVVEAAQPGILTARDVLDFVAAGHDGDTARVTDHFTPEARTTTPGAPLDTAAETMVEGGFRHLVVTDGGRRVGVLAMRDVVRCWVDEDATPRDPIPIRKAMSTDLLEVGADDTIRGTAEAMAKQRITAAIVMPDRSRSYPAIFTEREVVDALAATDDLESARIADHLAPSMTFSAPGWSVKQAAEAMRKGGFQHVVVVDRYEVRGVIAVRDIVQAWIARER